MNIKVHFLVLCGIRDEFFVVVQLRCLFAIQNEHLETQNDVIAFANFVLKVLLGSAWDFAGSLGFVARWVWEVHLYVPDLRGKQRMLVGFFSCFFKLDDPAQRALRWGSTEGPSL